MDTVSLISVLSNFTNSTSDNCKFFNAELLLVMQHFYIPVLLILVPI